MVIAMKKMHVAIRPVGNSQGVAIPKLLLSQLGLDSGDSAEMMIEGDAVVLRKPDRVLRRGWAKAAQKIADAGDDRLVMGDFGNAGDPELTW